MEAELSLSKATFRRTAVEDVKLEEVSAVDLLDEECVDQSVRDAVPSVST
jgi:hypothetical protein